MKAKKMTQKLTLLTFTALFIAFMFNACSDVAGPNNDNGSLKSSDEVGAQDIFHRSSTGGEAILSCGTFALTAGNGTKGNAGTLDVTLQGSILTVTYNTSNPWRITTTHLEAFNEIDKVDAPAPGSLQYGTDEYDPAVTNTTYEINLDDDGVLYGPDNTLYLIAHAVVERSNNGNNNSGETAWGGDDEGESNRWWYYATLECEEETGGETVFTGRANGRR